MAKKVWNFLRVMFLMLKKGISKSKLLADLNTIIKRGKSLHNLPVRPDEYEFSCTDTPPYPLSLFKKHHRHHHMITTHDALSPPLDISNDMLINVSVMKALEDMLTTANSASPVFGKQLKITDSPFMLSNGDDDQDGEVDEAADKFIMRFYNDLRREN
ncbi:hypothetical protein QVD17_02647 [Tagetes erecta]|uniref:Avr9/Cf-9 rapidly elicited protein 146 n=1 Tax=Tagetes erecta TaxID=13708 RepID=A0AAD8P7Z2_TARER|nr:hypothetical protein QVD17_02647 [Tagetes erecta]